MTLVFPPSVSRVSVPVTILDDEIPEPEEQFRLNLFTVVESPTLEIEGRVADVIITDEDGMYFVFCSLFQH